MNRYSVIFAAQMIEPDPQGKWVKHDDVLADEARVIREAEERAVAACQSERDQLQGKIAHANELIENYKGTEEEMRKLREATARYSGLIKLARERLQRHGHAPNCNSRYTRTEADGVNTNGRCNCELDEWMHESGVSHG